MSNDVSIEVVRTAGFECAPVGFIGLGVMGKSLAWHLLKAGYPMMVQTRTRAKAEGLIAEGAQWVDSPRDVAAGCKLIFTMVGFPHELEDVYFGARGIFKGVKPGEVLVDLTTSTPHLARRIAEAAQKLGVEALDIPVTGGEVGAREARLSMMAGGSPEAFARVAPVLKLFGPLAVLHGPPGSGQHAKMANQIMIAATMMGMCEALAYAKAAGLDTAKVLQSTSAGSASSWSLLNLAPRALRGDFAPGFYVKHFVKDLGIALGAAREMGIKLPGLALGEKLYRKLAAAGHGHKGTQALWLSYLETVEKTKAKKKTRGSKVKKAKRTRAESQRRRVRK